MTEEIVKLCFVGTQNPVLQTYGKENITYAEFKDAGSGRVVYMADAPFAIADKVAARNRLYIVLDPTTLKMRRTGESITQYLIRQGEQLTKAVRYPKMASELAPSNNFQFTNMTAVMGDAVMQAKEIIRQAQGAAQEIVQQAKAQVAELYTLMGNAKPPGLGVPDVAGAELALGEGVDLDLPGAEEFANAPSTTQDPATPQKSSRRGGRG